MLNLAEGLNAGLRSLGEDPDTHPCALYLAYLELLSRWNRAYNLTGVRDPERMLAYLLLDSLSILPFLRGERCLDAGTGAGLPGLILALARPKTNWTLLDSSGKKIRFLNRAIAELPAKNVQVAHSRLEDYQAEQPFMTIVSRALGSLPEFLSKSRHLLAPDGVLLAMKGAQPEAELHALDARGIRITIHRLQVPGVDSKRSVVCIEAGARSS